MIPESIYELLSKIREEYRQQMNAAAEKAQQFAASDEMDRVSEFSTESERKREAFSALNRVIRVIRAIDEALSVPSTDRGSK